MWQRIHFPWVTEQGNIQHNTESGRRTEAINQFYNMTRIHRVWERIFIRTAQAAKYDHMISVKSVYCLKSYIVCWIWRLRKNTQDWEQRIQMNQDNIAKVLSVWNNLKWFLKKHLHLVIFYKVCFKRFYIEWFHVTYLWFVLLSRKPLNRMCSNRRVNRLLSGFEETIIIMHPPNHCSTFKNKLFIQKQTDDTATDPPKK